MSQMRLFPERIEGRHVLIGLLAFFGVMFIANGIFLYYALGTFNGFETADAYRKGLSYNERIAAETAQAARGWQPAAHYETERGELVLTVRDARGRGVAGLSVTAELRRPATDREDLRITLSETAPARYAAPSGLAEGQWILLARIEEPGASGKLAFRYKQRILVKARQ
jgi:nitrogen fixation protein FixH